MELVFALAKDVVKVATPLVMVPVPMLTLPSRKVMTAPSGTGLPEVVVAVKVMDWLTPAGLSEEVTVVVVGAKDLLSWTTRLWSVTAHPCLGQELPVMTSGRPSALRSATARAPVSLRPVAPFWK